MVRPLPWLMLFVIAACGDDATPHAGPGIALPGRDGSTTPEADAASDGGAIPCEPGWGDCNGNPVDGCETNLVDSVDHCGACDRDCRTCGGATCSQSRCDAAEVATANGSIALLDVDADHLTYATASEVRQITRTDAKDQNVFAVASTPWLVATKTNVLFVFPGPAPGAGIYSTTAGFVGPQIPAYARGQIVDTFAYDDTGAYYAVQKGDTQARQLLRCNNCSVPTVLSDTENRFNQGAITLDSATVFFGSADMIRRVEKTADGLKTIAVGQSARTMQVDADYIYWINEDANDVARMPKAGGDVQKIATGLDKPRWLSLHNGRLYVGDAQAVSRMERDGSARLELVRAPGPLAVDGACVFVAAGSAVRRVTR